MRKENIYNLQASVTRQIVDVLMDFVREHGSDITDYERDLFDLYDEDGSHITKIFNFYDRDGCNVIGARCLIKELEDRDNPLSTILDTFSHMAINCLYIDRDDEGNDSLFYYGWYNDGVWYSEGFAEQEHGEVINFGLDELQNLLYVVSNYCDN